MLDADSSTVPLPRKGELLMYFGRINCLKFLASITFVVLATLVHDVSAQTYETTYTAQTADNTSACSSAGDNAGACAGANSVLGTKQNNPVPTNTSKQNACTLLGSWFNGKIIAAAMGWWPGTNGNHLCCVGYTSSNASQIQEQLQDMKSRGFDGATLSWSGVKGSTCTVSGNFTNCTKDPSVVAFEQWLTAAANDGTFQVAIRGQRYITSTYKNSLETDQQAMIRQLKYVQSKYFGSAGYMRQEIAGDGLGARPIVTFFINEVNCSGCDWNAIKTAVGNDVLLMKQDKNGYITPFNFEGAYSWGPSKNDDFDYENDFYGNSNNGAVVQPATRLVWTDASKGFNNEDPQNLGFSIWDSNTSKTYVDQKCGQRWLSTWGHVSTNFQNSSRRLDAVIVPTWDDYEEGTEVETGISNCFDAGQTTPITTSLSDKTLTWADQWDAAKLSSAGVSETEMEKTIHHYELYQSDPGNDEALHLFETINNPSPFASPYNPPSHSLDLTNYSIPCNAKIFVKAVGQSSVTNHMTSKAEAPSYCANAPYSYISGLELPTTDWALLDDCGSAASCSTVQATSTVHTAPDAVKFTLGGANPPGSQVGRWLRTVTPDTGDDANFELDLWLDLDSVAYSSSAGLIFEFSHAYDNYWYHFAFRCNYPSSNWQLWDELNNTWLTTSVSCSRPPQNTYTQLTFHMQRLSGNMLRYTDVQVNGGALSAFNRDLAAENKAQSNFNKIGVKLIGDPAMDDYSIYIDDLRLGYRQ
jgi:hypothetical protein